MRRKNGANIAAVSVKRDRRVVRITSKMNHIIDLFREHGAMSKIQAKKYSGYSMTTTLALFDQLAKSGYIELSHTDGRSETRGPKSTYFRLNDAARIYLGITFTRSGIYSAFVSFSGKVLKTFLEPLDINADAAAFIGRFREHLKTLRKEAFNAAHGPSAVCVSMPGTIDARAGKLLSYSFMPGLKDIDMRSIVADEFPGTALMFDQNITGFLSYVLMDRELIRSHRTILYVSLRAGAANGIIHDGKVVTPTGELGHVVVRTDGAACVCGRSGCLDRYLSHQSLSDELLRHMKGPGGTRDGYLSIDDIVAVRRNGECADIIDERFSLLGEALSDVTNVIAPDIIVLSGELFECYEDPVRAVKDRIRSKAASGINKIIDAKMIYRPMGTEASAVGLCYNRIDTDFGYRIEEELNGAD